MFCYIVVTLGLLPIFWEAAACPSMCDCYHDNQLAHLFNYQDTFTSDCKTLGLKKLPVGIDGETRHLYMSHNNLSVLFANIFSDTRFLLSLDLDNNNINKIDVDAFSGLTELKTLSLGNNQITSLHVETFRDCPNLWSLELNGNRVHLPQDVPFLNAPSILSLDISNCGIIHLPNLLFQSSNSRLQELKLNRNDIQEIKVDSFPSLLRLELDYNKIEYLEVHTFDNNKHLTHLSLNGNPIRPKKDESIINSQSLQYLHMNNCGIEQLTGNTFNGILNIVELQLSNNSIDIVDKTVFPNLPELHDLSLGSNRITSIHSDAFLYNTRLRVLDLSHNPLLLVPDQPLIKAPSLWSLVLDGCGLANLPSEVFLQTADLRELSVAHNSLQTIHITTIQNMIKLQHLDMSNNPFYCNSTLKEVWFWCNEKRIKTSATCKSPNGDWEMLRYLNFTTGGTIIESNPTKHRDQMYDFSYSSLLNIGLRYGLVFIVVIVCIGMVLIIRRILKYKSYFHDYDSFEENHPQLLIEGEIDPPPEIGVIKVAGVLDRQSHVIQQEERQVTDPPQT